MAAALRRAISGGRSTNTASLLRHLSSSSPSYKAARCKDYSFPKALFQSCDWLTHQDKIDASLHNINAANPSVGDDNSSFGEEIAPDAVCFEGCDYKHWLIIMDFPQNLAPTREEMIETYLQTLAKVVGSYKEAKKKMYAFSTTTYAGFQCLVSKEESDKFKGMPHVVFVLPDSYIDSVIKEYGGDKYEDGVITPRPPPKPFGRQGGRHNCNTGYDNQGPSYGDNRNFVPQQTSSVPNQQGSRGYDNQGPAYMDNRNFGPQENPLVLNQPFNQGYDNQGPIYGSNGNSNQTGNQSYDYRNSAQLQNPSVQPNFGPGGGERGSPSPMSNAPGVRDSVPLYECSNCNPSQQGYYNPQGVRSQLDQWDYAGNNRNYAPPQRLTQGQGVVGYYGQVGGGIGQEFGGTYGQMGGGNYGQVPGGYYNPQGVRSQPDQWDYAGDNRNYAPPQRLTLGQGVVGYYGQVGGGIGQEFGGTYGQMGGGNYGQVPGGYYNPQGVRSQPDQWDYAGDNRNYAPPQRLTQGQGLVGYYGQVGGGIGQEFGGTYGQMGGGNYGQVPGGYCERGAGGNHSQNYQHQQTEHMNNLQTSQTNYGQMGQSGGNQRRY